MLLFTESPLCSIPKSWDLAALAAVARIILIMKVFNI